MSVSADRRFINRFAIVIILVHVITITFFVLARLLAGRIQQQYLREDEVAQQAVATRIAPFARVAVAGADNSALALVDNSGPGAGAAAGDRPSLDLGGKETFATACTVCHTTGVSGAPRLGDAAAWRPRIGQGKRTLYEHALKGFQGSQGLMPPKGGRPDLTDESVMRAVDYMIANAR